MPVLLICRPTTRCEEERGMWSFANLLVAKRNKVPGVGYKEPVVLKFNKKEARFPLGAGSSPETNK